MEGASEKLLESFSFYHVSRLCLLITISEELSRVSLGIKLDLDLDSKLRAIWQSQ
jgi:hypothetical protein